MAKPLSIKKASAACQFILWLYSGLWEIVWLCVRLASLFSSTLRARAGERAWRCAGPGADFAAAEGYCTLFFCSSAGEYEQAKPVMDLLDRNPQHQSVIAFFSTSGLRFAAARGEQRFAFLAPPDALWRWRTILKSLQVRRSVVVRHELWPAFLESAAAVGPVYLINGTLPAGKWSRRLPFIKRSLGLWIEKVFVVDTMTQSYFQGILGFEPAKVRVVGDTKYDRVIDRMQSAGASHTKLRQHLDKIGLPSNLVVVGSAWPADVRVLADCLPKLSLPKNWGIAVAPHEVDSPNIETILAILRTAGVRARRISEDAAKNCLDAVLIVDSMGILSDLYGIASVAVVGGAFHNKVHNVLEPACYGLEIAFGPRFENSAEARKLVTAGLCEVLRGHEDLTAFLESNFLGRRQRQQEIAQFVKHLGGASSKVAAEILDHER